MEVLSRCFDDIVPQIIRLLNEHDKKRVAVDILRVCLSKVDLPSLRFHAPLIINVSDAAVGLSKLRARFLLILILCSWKDFLPGDGDWMWFSFCFGPQSLCWSLMNFSILYRCLNVMFQWEKKMSNVSSYRHWSRHSRLSCRDKDLVDETSLLSSTWSHPSCSIWHCRALSRKPKLNEVW